MNTIRQWIGKLLGFATQPLLLAQIATSLASAVAMLLAAAMMPPDQFVRYSLISLVSFTAFGMVRTGIYQPALIELRNRDDAHTRFRNAALASLAASLGATVVIYAMDPISIGEAALLLGTGALPTLQDWVRFRALEFDRRWAVFAADGLRLAFTVVLSPIALVLTNNPVIFQSVQGLAYAIPALVVFPRLPKVSRFAPLRSYGRSASLQLGDYVIGQFNTTVPLLVLGGLGASAVIGGVRLAQTLLGPLGLVFSAFTTNLMVDATNDDRLSHPRAMYRAGEKLANWLGLLSVAAIGTLVLVVWASGISLRGVANSNLLAGLVLVGAAMSSSGWAGIHAVILRLLNYQVTATVGRAVLVAASLTGFIIGYFVGGVDASLVCGFLAAAVASPVAFVLPSAFIYHRFVKPTPQ